MSNPMMSLPFLDSEAPKTPRHVYKRQNMYKNLAY